MYQNSSERSRAHTGDVSPKNVLPWEPKEEIKDYFMVHAERLRSLLIKGKDPRPGNFICKYVVLLSPSSVHEIFLHADIDEELLIQGEVTTLIPAFNATVSKVIDRVFLAEGRPERFGSWAMPGNIIPDFLVAVKNTTTYSRAYVAGEAKVTIRL